MAIHGVQIVEVDAEHGSRLDNFLLGRLKGVPRSRVYRMVRRGEVRVNGGRATPHYRLRRGDAVRVPPHRGSEQAHPHAAPAKAVDALAKTLRDRTVYEDAHLLVLDKPSGIAVHGGSGVALGVIEALRRMDGDEGYALAHRLDRDTSGCLILAKNRRTLLELHAAFRAGQVGKRYDAIVAGHWPPDTRRVEKPLLRLATTSGERRVRVDARGESARTDFKVVRHLGRPDGDSAATWLAAFPRTGRTHQIRVHAAATGHPIVGDQKYAPDDDASRAPRLLLHATTLTLRLGDTRRRFEAAIPPAFKAFASARPKAAR